VALLNGLDEHRLATTMRVCASSDSGCCASSVSALADVHI